MEIFMIIAFLLLLIGISLTCLVVIIYKLGALTKSDILGYIVMLLAIIWFIYLCINVSIKYII